MKASRLLHFHSSRTSEETTLEKSKAEVAHLNQVIPHSRSSHRKITSHPLHVRVRFHSTPSSVSIILRESCPSTEDSHHTHAYSSISPLVPTLTTFLAFPAHTYPSPSPSLLPAPYSIPLQLKLGDFFSGGVSRRGPLETARSGRQAPAVVTTVLLENIGSHRACQVLVVLRIVS